MPTYFLPQDDLALQAWLNNFAETCEKYESELDLDTEELAEINGAASGFSTDLTAQSTAKAILKGATAAKNSAKTTANAVARKYAKEFKANPTVSSEILSELQIVSNAVTSPVTTVTGVSVTGCDDGVNKVTWNRNGNSQGTSFIIEYRVDGQSNWNFAGVVTKVKFDHENQTPGVMTWYRIISTRAGTNSAPSVAVAAYPNSSGNSLSIAA